MKTVHSKIYMISAAMVMSATMPTIRSEDRFHDGKQSKPNYQRFNQHKLRKKK